MLAIDTSDSMINPIPAPVVASSCGFGSRRIDHARCAVRKTIQAFGGQVNLGLAGFAAQMTNCPAGACNFGACTYSNLPNDSGPWNGQALIGCGNENPNAPLSPNRKGANIVVPMQQDDYWNSPSQASNVAELLSWVDDTCTGNKELWAGGTNATNGLLRDMHRYFTDKWVHPSGAPTFNTPLGTLAQGERPCRQVAVILLTDGDEFCDEDPANDALAGKRAPEYAAEALLTGFTVGGITWSVKTHVINFANPGAQILIDKVAAAGGTGASIVASNETAISTALATIIGNSVKPETCDNLDNNCNGCTDEGFKHYCDVQPAGGCCTWKTPAQKTACGATACACCNAQNQTERDTCIANFKATITAANPQGDISLLPCTTPAQQANPATWLCFDPTETCDTLDNNCQGGVDEGTFQCGNPLHCPSTEVCDGIDNDCDGLVDEGCPQPCVQSAEICDGCDNDCDGVADDGVADVPCGISGPGIPAYCAGVLKCKPAQNVAQPGGCTAGGGFQACTATTQPETCNGLDDNCNGVIDDGVASVACVPAGTPAGLNYGANSQCKMGQTACINGSTVCQGFIGPSAVEICDGIDNDCDGQVDEGVPGLGQTCGINTPPCSPGTTACVNGAIVCQGGVGPKPEICDGLDNDCDTLVDESPLADAPAAGMNGCWSVAGNTCQFPAAAIPGAPAPLKWGTPPSATCTGAGGLSAPCHAGILACNGVSGWICTSSKEPAPETCDNQDNDCNGQVDDGNFAGIGQLCGPAIPPCVQGMQQCVNGVITCVGGVGPTPEICNAMDDDCNGQIDDGIPIGADCTVAYDTSLYPGDHSQLPCQPGHLQCDGMGSLVCVGGVGPSPEVCDGIDNDCDGIIDEAGMPPEGVNGTQNQFPPPAAAIGDACGSDVGECDPGAYACVNGSFACVGGLPAKLEECDCKDNDCDGMIDNENPAGRLALCAAPGSSCVKASSGCLCAVPCGDGEFPCPVGQKCEQVTSSQTGQELGGFCVSDSCNGDCTPQKVLGPNDTVICAPDGTPADDNCVKPPVCVCKGGQDGCKNPCFGVVCGVGSVCPDYGPKKGTCVQDNCYNNPCQGCGRICVGGTCIDGPCKPDSCPATEECKPSADFLSFTCVPPCGDLQCPSGKACVDGVCVDSCDPPCAANQVCDKSKSPPTCVPNLCDPNPCTDGSYCDPITGNCGNYPCTGIICPGDTTCTEGECTKLPAPMTTSSSATGAGGGGSGAGGGGGSSAKGVWGLATGGGGCACEVGPGASRWDGARWALVAAALAVSGLRRRNRKRESR